MAVLAVAPPPSPPIGSNEVLRLVSNPPPHYWPQSAAVEIAALTSALSKIYFQTPQLKELVLLLLGGPEFEVPDAVAVVVVVSDVEGERDPGLELVLIGEDAPSHRVKE